MSRKRYNLFANIKFPRYLEFERKYSVKKFDLVFDYQHRGHRTEIVFYTLGPTSICSSLRWRSELSFRYSSDVFQRTKWCEIEQRVLIIDSYKLKIFRQNLQSKYFINYFIDTIDVGWFTYVLSKRSMPLKVCSINSWELDKT